VKRTSRIATFVVIVAFLAASGAQKPSLASGLDNSTSNSVLTTWQTGQASNMSDTDKIRATVDAYFCIEYANRMSASFTSRTLLFCANTDQAQTWGRYADALLAYNILCWQSNGYVPTAYKYAPMYDKIIIDSSGLVATVTMVPTCTLTLASTSMPEYVGSDKHVLTLQKRDGAWLIALDTNNSMDSTAYPLNTDFDELTKTYPARLAACKKGQADLLRQAQEETATMRKNNDPRLKLLDPQKGGDAVPTVTGSGLSGAVVPATLGYTDYNRSRAAQYTYLD
jgi:hypothetical protein